MNPRDIPPLLPTPLVRALEPFPPLNSHFRRLQGRGFRRRGGIRARSLRGCCRCCGSSSHALEVGTYKYI